MTDSISEGDVTRVSGMVDADLTTADEIRGALDSRFRDDTMSPDAKAAFAERIAEKREGQDPDEPSFGPGGDYYYVPGEKNWREGGTGRFAEDQE